MGSLDRRIIDRRLNVLEHLRNAPRCAEIAPAARGHAQHLQPGRETLDDLRIRCERKAAALGVPVTFRQSNHEGELVAWIQEARTEGAGLIVNAGAFTHTSIALLDALLACTVPCVEVHLSNIFAREPFRHHSYISKAVKGVICGFGATGYELAIEALASTLAPAKAK